MNTMARFCSAAALASMNILEIRLLTLEQPYSLVFRFGEKNPDRSHGAGSWARMHCDLV